MLNRDEVEHLFELARIKVSAVELEKLPGELDSILAYARKLSDAPIGDIPPTLSFAPALKELRHDVETTPSESDADMLRESFPEREGRFLKTKKVFGE